MSERAAAAAPAGQGYHHGDLREALLRAGAELLAEEGVDGFTLRACARRAGVSHAAPAHHFRDRRGLLTALAAKAAGDMAALMGELQAQAGDDPFARLRAAGVAYIEYALRQPASFRLMCRRDAIDPGDPVLQAAGLAGRQYLVEGMRELLAARGIDESGLEPKLLLAWATVHGFAALVLDRDLMQDVAPEQRATVARERAVAMLSLLEPAFLDG